MKTQFLLLDADDTVLDWHNHFKQFVLRKDIPLKGPDLTEWDLSSWLDISKEDIKNLVHEFNCSENFKSIPAFDDAKHILKELAKEYNLVIITSCSTQLNIQEGRVFNLREQFGDVFHKIHCLDYEVSKKETLNLYPNSVFIDDKMDNLIDALSTGHTPYIIDRVFNKNTNHPKIKRVFNWHEIKSILDQTLKVSN